MHAELLKQLGPKLYASDMDANELDRQVRNVLSDVLARQEKPLSNSDRMLITQEISDDILGYGPIEPFLRDGEVSEVMVNGPDSIWVERKGRLTPVKAQFTDEKHLRRTIDKIVSRIGRRVDESSPMVDARLPDGSRVNAVIPPLAVDGSALTIRKFSTDPLTVNDLIKFGSLSPQTAELPRRLRPRPAQRHRLRRYRLGEDHDAQRAVVLHPRATSASSPSRTPPSSSSSRSTSSASSRARPTSRARARSRSATWSRTACACGPTG